MAHSPCHRGWISAIVPGKGASPGPVSAEAPPNGPESVTQAPFYNIIWKFCGYLAAAGSMRGRGYGSLYSPHFKPPWMKFGNVAVNILVFRLGILSRDYVPKRWSIGNAQNGETGKSSGVARISLAPHNPPGGLDAEG